jgi:hypothetical protein
MHNTQIVNIGDSFTTAQVATLLGKSTRFVTDWTERGIFLADIQSASGFGSRREYSYAAVLRGAWGLSSQEKFHLSRDFIKNILNMLWLKGFFKDWSEKIIEKDDEGLLPIFLLILNPHDEEKSKWFSLTGKLDEICQKFPFLSREAEAALFIDLIPTEKSIDEKIAQML